MTMQKHPYLTRCTHCVKPMQYIGVVRDPSDGSQRELYRCMNDKCKYYRDRFFRKKMPPLRFEKLFDVTESLSEQLQELEADDLFTDDPIGYVVEHPDDKRALEIVKHNPEWAYHYINDVLKSRWPEAEQYIKKDPEWAYYYALNVIGGRWRDAEPFIKKNLQVACAYATKVIKRRWPEAEPYIKKDPSWACWYAKDVIKGRWPEAERYIKKSADYAYWYSRYVMKDRWPEAESTIMKDPEVASWYARDVIKGEWPNVKGEDMKRGEISENVEVVLDGQKYVLEKGDKVAINEGFTADDAYMAVDRFIQNFTDAELKLIQAFRGMGWLPAGGVSPMRTDVVPKSEIATMADNLMGKIDEVEDLAKMLLEEIKKL